MSSMSVQAVSKNRRSPYGSGNGKGFALITAILAVMILMALGILALNVSTGDLRISSRLVGEKKALVAAEAGIHRMMQDFDPTTLMASQVGVNYQVDAATDPATRYRISNVGKATSGPETLPLAGYAISGGQQWGQSRFEARVTGEHTNYKTSVPVDVGMGYGPIEISTMYR
jgi:Tfp pilus assembly protein PilX